MAFQLPYQFAKDNKVVIQHRRNGNFNEFHSVRVNDDDSVGHDGKRGKFAQWHAEKKGQNKVMFKSVHSGKYLRIHNGVVDVKGGGGAFCVFKRHDGGDGTVKLEAEKEGKYLAFRPNQGVCAGQGGNMCHFKVWREGQHGGGGGSGGGGGGHFENLYGFRVKNTVVIQHRRNGNFQQFGTIRTAPNGGVAHNGGKGNLAQFEVEKLGPQKVMMKSLNTGKYLRIHGPNNVVDCAGNGGGFCHFSVHHQGQNGVVKLQAVKNGKWLAVKNDGVFAGGGGDHCKLKFWRKN